MGKNGNGAPAPEKKANGAPTYVVKNPILTHGVEKHVRLADGKKAPQTVGRGVVIQISNPDLAQKWLDAKAIAPAKGSKKAAAAAAPEGDGEGEGDEDDEEEETEPAHEQSAPIAGVAIAGDPKEKTQKPGDQANPI